MAYQFDFDSIKNRLIQRLRAKSSWANILFYSTNLRLIEAFAEELADLAQYDEYLTRETKWSLARNRSSLLSSQAIHKYSAHRKIGAFGKIRVAASDAITSSDWIDTSTYSEDDIVYYDDVLYIASQDVPADQQPDESPTYWDLLDISPSVNIDIPKWTTFSDESGDYKFVTYTAESLNVGQNYIDIDVVQGTAKSYSATASGTSNEEFLLEDSTIENSRFELYVNDVLWTKVDSLLEQGSSDTSYEIENKIDFSGIYLKFGDDVYGKKLSNGDSIKFYYVSTEGSERNIESSNIIIKIVSTLYDTNGDRATAYCTNKESLLGGSDEEDIESIRLNAPKIFQTGDRASSYDDYKAIIENNFNFVLKAIVWGAYEYNIDNNLDPWTFVDTEENVVHVAVISQSEENLTETQKLLISEGINQYKAPTDIVTYETVRFLNLAFRTTAYVSNTAFTLSSVSNSIRSILSSTYNVQELDLYESIYFSDYQSLIDSVSGVDHHTTYAEIFYDYDFTTGYVVDDFTLPSINIRPESVRVYIQDTVGGQTNWTLIGEDDGSGNIVAETGYTFLSSAINYSTGACILQLSTLPEVYTNYTVRVFYRLVSDDLLLNKRYDIFRFDSTESTITSQYISSR